MLLFARICVVPWIVLKVLLMRSVIVELGGLDLMRDYEEGRCSFSVIFWMFPPRRIINQ